MARRAFSAGFAWSVIELKWPGFEEAFLGFEPARLAFEPDEFWDGLVKDARIVRNGAKIASVRETHASSSMWRRSMVRSAPSLPIGRHPTRLDSSRSLAGRGSRLGGNSGQMLLRFLGYDAFVTSKDVVACLRDAGLDIAEAPTSKRDLLKIQEQFNTWAKETGLPYTHLSRICALSMGRNHQGDADY